MEPFRIIPSSISDILIGVIEDSMMSNKSVIWSKTAVGQMDDPWLMELYKNVGQVLNINY